MAEQKNQEQLKVEENLASLKKIGITINDESILFNFNQRNPEAIAVIEFNDIRLSDDIYSDAPEGEKDKVIKELLSKNPAITIELVLGNMHGPRSPWENGPRTKGEIVRQREVLGELDHITTSKFLEQLKAQNWKEIAKIDVRDGVKGTLFVNLNNPKRQKLELEYDPRSGYEWEKRVIYIDDSEEQEEEK